MMITKTTSRIFFSIVILILLVALPGCQAKAPAAQKELTTVRYGGQLYPEEFVLAGDPQLWADQGLKVEHTLFSSGTENNQALISNAVDINIGSDSKTVPLMIAMPDQAVIIAVSQRGDRYSTLVKQDSPYQSWSDLKGKTIGINLTTGSEQVVRRYFQNSGMKWEDYNWVNMKNETMIAALTDGKVDAFTAWEPTPAVAEAQGVARVIMSYGDVALTPVLIHTTKKYAAEHHEEIVRFLAAQIKKAELIKSDPKKAAEFAVKAATEKGTKVSAEAFEKIFKRIDFSVTLDDSVIAAINDTAQFLVDQKQVDKIPTIVYDKSFLEEAQKLVNGK